jgi:hypothetical protein
VRRVRENARVAGRFGRLVLAAVALAGALTITAPASPAVAAPRFNTNGRWMTDATGRPLILRGLDVMGAEFTPTSAPLPFDGADFTAIAATGATVVRLPIAWANIEPVRGHYDAAALARVKTIVEQAGAAGLLVILDMHQWHWSPCFGGNGMPEWATNPCPHVSWDQSNPLLEAIPQTRFWSDHALQRRFAAMWAAVARALGSQQNLLGYEILNEPPLGLFPPAVFEKQVLVPFYKLVAARLRAVDPGALIVVEPAITGQFHRLTMTSLGIDRAVYSTHLYGASLNDAGGHAGDFAGPAQFAPDLRLGALEAKRLGAAFWPGEWGYLDETAPVGYRELQYAEDMLTAQDQLMVGSAYWTFWKQGFPYTPPIQAILRRPTPFAIGGTPLSFSTSRTSLHIRWTSNGRPTRVRVPGDWTPLVHTAAGSAPVTVTVQPGGWVDMSARRGDVVEVVIDNG